jgi:hypothetical protein
MVLGSFEERLGFFGHRHEIFGRGKFPETLAAYLHLLLQLSGSFNRTFLFHHHLERSGGIGATMHMRVGHLVTKSRRASTQRQKNQSNRQFVIHELPLLIMNGKNSLLNGRKIQFRNLPFG